MKIEARNPHSIAFHKTIAEAKCPIDKTTRPAMSKLVRPTVLFLSAFLASELQAKLVTMSFTAFTHEVRGDPFGSGLEGGEPIAGTFTYDTESSIRQPPLDTQETYVQTGGALTSYEIIIDGDTVLTPFTNDWHLSVSNGPDNPDICIDCPPNEGIGISHGLPIGYGGSVAVDGVEAKSVGLNLALAARNEDVLPGTLANLPNPLPSLEVWEAAGGGGGGIIWTDGGLLIDSESAIILTMTSFQIVPEPSAFACGLLSLLLLVHPVRTRIRNNL